MARPGLILYFELLEPLRKLSDADRGKLLIAILEYGKDGIEPDFDGVLALTWGFVRPKLDRDKGAYENSKLQRKYAVFCKKRSGLGLEKIPFDEWIDMTEDERIRAVTAGNEPQREQRSVNFVASRYPSITETGTETETETGTVPVAVAETESESESESESEFPGGAFAAAADRNVSVIGGELGKNVVFLSEAQMADLLDRMGLETFDYYVAKLSTFIIKNNASVKNHYETILKWWQEDGSVHPRAKPSGKKEIPKGASGKLGKEELDAIQRVLKEG